MTLPGPDDAAFWQTVGAIGALVLVGAATSAWKFFNEKKKEEPNQIVLEKASVADIRPITDIRNDLSLMLKEEEKQTIEIRAIKELLQHQAEQREDDDRMKRIVAEALASQKKPRAPRRRTTQAAKPATI